MPNPRNAAWGGTGGDGSTSVVGNPNAIPMPGAPVVRDLLYWDGDSWEATKPGALWRRDIDDGPPGSPTDGDIWIAEDVGGENSGVAWSFVYNADSSSSFKWECTGGSPLSGEVLTSESFANAAYSDWTTAGPSVTVPRAGDYIVRWGASAALGTAAATGYISVKRGTAATSDNDGFRVPVTDGFAGLGAERRFDGLAAADVLKMQGKASAGTILAAFRRISALPVRIS